MDLNPLEVNIFINRNKIMPLIPSFLLWNSNETCNFPRDTLYNNWVFLLQTPLRPTPMEMPYVNEKHSRETWHDIHSLEVWVSVLPRTFMQVSNFKFQSLFVFQQKHWAFHTSSAKASLCFLSNKIKTEQK